MEELYMALTRKFLAALGIESEKIDQIVEANAESLADIQDKLAKANAELKEAKSKADTLPTVQKELDDLKAQVEADNKAREGKDYDALKKEYDDYKAEVQEKAVKSAKEKALRDLLSDMKVSDKGTSMIMKYMGVSGIELDEEGKLKDAASIKKAVKEDWSDYIPTVETKGADTKTPPTDGKGGGVAKTREEIMAIKDTTARQEAIAENLELFQ
jgi:multidrug efflux pump subunit AcrA (membrane-fusion protein)